MGASDEPMPVSRRGFLGWGAALLSTVVVPGAALVLTGGSAAAAISPYALASWQALVQGHVRAFAPGHPSVALQVVKVTDMARPSRMEMSGDAFVVTFRGSAPLPSRIYTITAAGMGSFPLFLDGPGAAVQGSINVRLPVRG